MSDLGSVFPPRTEWDVLAYDIGEVTDGYRDWRSGEPAPGDNRTPAYRWGWMNRQRDSQAESDGYDEIRVAYVLARRDQWA